MKSGDRFLNDAAKKLGVGGCCMADQHPSLDDAVAYWKNQFSLIPPEELAVVKASGKVLTDENLGPFAQDMRYLANNGFYLPVVIGGGPQYDVLPAYRDGSSSKVVIHGRELRTSPVSLMEQMLPVALQNQERVAAAFRAAGVASVAIPFDVVHAKPYVKRTDQTIDELTNTHVDLGFVGAADWIDTDSIIHALRAGQIPVVSHLGARDGIVYNINATSLAAALVRELEARKLIMLGDQPVKDGDATIRTFASERHFEHLVDIGVITGGMVTNVRDAFDTLRLLGPDHSVQITTLKKKANNGNGDAIESTGLFEELLGDGSGTKVMMPSPVKVRPLSSTQYDTLREMVNTSFASQGKRLVAGYFESIAGKKSTIYLDRYSRGGAISYPLPGFPSCEYLCKLFRREGYEGQGIGTSLIETLVVRKSAVVWRTSATNGVLRFYQSTVDQYDGFHHFHEPSGYHIFGVGIPEQKRIGVINLVAAIPKTLEPSGGAS